MIVANIFDFIDGKVAHEIERGQRVRRLLGLGDRPVLGPGALRRPDLPLLVAATAPTTCSITSIAMVFATMTSYTRARAESLIPKCKVGFMERPERIVLFMIGAFTNRMAAVLWVIRVLSVVTVVDRIIYTYLELANAPGRRVKPHAPLPLRVLWNAFFWTDERATLAYDLMVIAILAFVWLTPPDWLGDPMAAGTGPIGWLLEQLR